MSEGQIPNVSGSPYTPKKIGIGLSKENKNAAKKINAETPKDVLQLSGGKQAVPVKETGTSQSDMARYLNLLSSEPEIREDLVEKVKGKLERGEYGAEALEGTLDGISQELGISEE